VRVCYVCNVNVAEENAAKIHVFEVAEGLARRGHRVRLLAPALGQHHDITPLEMSYLPVRFGAGHMAAAFNASLAGYLPWIAAHFRPHVYYVREFFRCLTPVLAARATGTPLVLEVNGIMEDEAAAVGLRLDRTTAHLHRRLYHAAAAIVAVTDGIREYLVGEFGVPAERITVLANGVNARLFHPLDRGTVKQALGLGSTPVVGFIGHFQVWQGVDQLLRAAPEVLALRPETRFVLVGAGPREQEYRELARALGVAHAVWFPGPVPVAESPRWINAFDVAVALKQPIASGYSPLKLYSYMACGRPVLGSRLPGFEEVENWGAGMLVRHDDPGAIARAIVALLADPARADAMGAAGRQLAMERHSWEHVVRETERICRAVRCDAVRSSHLPDLLRWPTTPEPRRPRGRR
jgi:glycosyltransferase involved in cell wall biosynthesis